MASSQKFTNWRFNPFTNTINQVALTEEHTVQYFPESNLYGIQAHEGIVLDNPSSVSLAYKEDGNEVALQEVPKSQPPSSGQFRVDYDAETFFSTSLVELNSADVGKTVILRYKGNGAIIKNEYIFNQLSTIPTNLLIQGALRATSTASFEQDITASKGIRLAQGASGTNIDMQVPNFGQVKQQFFPRGFEILTTSGTWTRPDHVQSVIAIVVGGGSGPHVNITSQNIHRNATIINGSSGQVRAGRIDVSAMDSVNYVVGSCGRTTSISIPRSVGFSVPAVAGGNSTFSSITAEGGPLLTNGFPNQNPSESIPISTGSEEILLNAGGNAGDDRRYPARWKDGLLYGIGFRVSGFGSYDFYSYYNGIIILIY